MHERERAPGSAAALLAALERSRGEFGAGASAHKLALLRRLLRRQLRGRDQVLRLHECLLFLRAYPDDRALLDAVETALRDFEHRADLRAAAARLADSGVAGTVLRYRFYWPTAQWLAAKWPQQLQVDWAEFDHRDWLLRLLPLLLPYTETLALDEIDREPKEWLATLKAPAETDAAFLVRRVASLPAGSLGREALYDALDVPVRLTPGASTPSRTKDRFAGAGVTFQTVPLDRSRPDLHADALVPPRSLRAVSSRVGQQLIDLARSAMVTRSRDLDAFCNADPRDVRVADCGGGLRFALMGVVPERRLMLESSYGVLTLQNGIPIGYVLVSAAFGSAAIAFNVFDTFRGGEAARILGRVLAVTRTVFGADAFSIDPYQLGDGNEEGLHSGAWWFYQKLGFRPADPGIDRLMRRELRRMQADPRHRSTLPTMRSLVADSMYFFLGRPRRDVLGMVDLGAIGLAASSLLARSGSDREGAVRACTAAAARQLGVGSLARWPRSERLWFERWSPLLLSIPDLGRWSAIERRAAVAVVRAKGGLRESEFVRRLDQHPRLRASLLALKSHEGVRHLRATSLRVHP